MRRPAGLPIAVFALLSGMAAAAVAAEPLNNPVAVFSGLDKLTGRIISFDVLDCAVISHDMRRRHREFIRISSTISLVIVTAATASLVGSQALTMRAAGSA